MKAVYATGTNYDDPLSVLEVGTMPEPETKPFWSTIRVNSASVNHHDVWICKVWGFPTSRRR